ncbi:TNT domain-containing protein [Streptococcus dentapri]|uniref:TNT domain-containing protein n=1 Tax=Streptococcus dentapri TaxID=573564 RepID=A0ABV8D2B7_9STRE
MSSWIHPKLVKGEDPSLMQVAGLGVGLGGRYVDAAHPRGVDSSAARPRTETPDLAKVRTPDSSSVQPEVPHVSHQTDGSGLEAGAVSGAKASDIPRAKVGDVYAPARAGEVTGANASDVPRAKVDEVEGPKGTEPVEASPSTDDYVPFKDQMSETDARRYEQWNKYAEAGIEPADRVKLGDWTYQPDAKLYQKYKSVYDNPKYYDQETGSINWPENDGFSGEPKKIVLTPGTRVDRYGSDYGSFISPEGIPYEQRAVAPGTDLKPYSVFEVVEPLEVKAGEVAPWFDEPGGGIQYLLPDTVDELLDNNIIRRVE